LQAAEFGKKKIPTSREGKSMEGEEKGKDKRRNCSCQQTESAILTINERRYCRLLRKGKGKKGTQQRAQGEGGCSDSLSELARFRENELAAALHTGKRMSGSQK